MVTALGFIPSGATLLLCEPIRELSVALPVLFVGTEGPLMQWVFLQVILGCWLAAKGLGAQSAQLSISAAPGLLLALLCPSARAHVSPRQQRLGAHSKTLPRIELDTTSHGNASPIAPHLLSGMVRFPRAKEHSGGLCAHPLPSWVLGEAAHHSQPPSMAEP